MVSRHQRFLDTVRLMCRKGHYPADMQNALQRQLKQLVDEWYLMLSSNQQWPLMLTSAARYFSLAPLQSARSAFNGGWQWLMLGYRRMRKWKLQP
jgi:hypothetical protein